MLPFRGTCDEEPDLTKFDDWAQSSARHGGVLNAWKARRATHVEPAPNMTRRQLMKRAGIVGAATVWATPLIQSVVTPAWAAVSCAPNCPNGSTCTLPAECASLTCAGGLCVAAGSIVNASPCGAGTTAQKDASCQSGYCNGSNVCAAPPGNVALGGACHGNTTTEASANCASGRVCSGGTVGTTPTTSGTCLIPSGTACSGTSDTSCASGYCSGTTCTNPPGTPNLAHNADCSGTASGLCTAGQQCTASVCKTSLGGSCSGNADCASNNCSNGLPASRVCLA